jgi:hypothetical protein
MIEISVTEEMVLHANKNAKELGHLRNSIMSGEGNLVGFLGEEATKKYLGIPLGTKVDDKDLIYNCDLIFNSESIDVKTKKTTVIPKDYYEASICASNIKQTCKYYVFTRALCENNQAIPSKIFIMGYILKDEYYEKARFLQEGQIDGSNNFRVRKDCYNLLYRDLYPAESLLSVKNFSKIG